MKPTFSQILLPVLLLFSFILQSDQSSVQRAGLVSHVEIGYTF